MTTPLDTLSDAESKALRRCAQPEWTSPMLATLTQDYFSSDAWIFERKLDGERIVAYRKSGKVRLMTRNRKNVNATYPELVDALQNAPGPNWIVDGEVVAFDGNVTSFQQLQQRMKISDARQARKASVKVYYYLFDVLHLDRFDTTTLPLRSRKKLLRHLLPWNDPLRYLPHRNTEGESYHDEACQKGWEGIIAKKAASPYAHSRSSNWLKFKCVNTQEFVIGGFTEPQGQRVGFGALLIGYFDDGNLRYAGKVGTGYDDETLKQLRQRMERLEVDQPPFVDDKLPRKGVHWIKPGLVGQFGFTELTREHRLRHPRFLGLRRDKAPTKVHLETESN